MSHTPGPWGWDSRNGNWYLLTFAHDAPHQIVAELKTPLDAMGGADRCLIASAPDLYEAVQECERFLGEASTRWEWADGTPFDRARLRAALAKARGEQP